MEENNNHVVVIEKKTNGIGTAGFILSLLSFLGVALPVVGWIIWFLGALFSFIGMFKKPRGLAVTGFILSIIDLIILIAFAGVIMGVVGAILS